MFLQRYRGGVCSIYACLQDRSSQGFAVDASLIKADANRQRGNEGLPPEAAGRAIDEYLAVLDDAAFGAATEVTPKFVSPSDPAARWTGASAIDARSSLDAALSRLRGKYSAQSMRALAIWRARSQDRGRATHRVEV
jgi:hypothetical protein